MQRRVILASALFGISLMLSPAWAQDYPNRPIKVVVPAAAGGVTDTPARIVAERMRESLKQPLVIENQGGAGGIIGSEAVKRAAPDGYTLLYVNAATHGLIPSLKKSVPYDALTDFKPIVMTVRAPMAIVVHKDSPIKTIKDLVESSRTQDKPLNYGSPGPGNTSHLVGLMLADASKSKMQAVHYRGEAPMIQDLLARNIDFIASNMIRSQVESGQLRVLATTGDKRWFVFPDAPTLKESGFNAEYYAWSGFVAPAATPDAIINRVNDAANLALAREDVRKSLMENGFEIIGGKPEVFAQAMRKYIDSVRTIGRANQIQID